MYRAKTPRIGVKKLLACLVAAVALTASGCSNAGGAENYPNGNIRVIIPFGAGGGTDADARAVIQKMDEDASANIVAENVSGGGGTLGLMQAMGKSADGHTVGLVFPSIHAMGQVVFDAGYDLSEMEYIGGFRESYNVIATTKSSGIETLDDLLALGKEKGRLVVTSGPKSAFIVTAQQVADLAGAKLESLNYEGVPQAFAAMEAGDGDFWMGGDGAAAGLGDDINVLAYAAPERSKLLPDTPTLSELGYDDIYLDPISAGFVVRKGTDPAIVEKLRSMLKDAATSDHIKEYAKKTQASMVYSDADEFKQSVMDAVDVCNEYHDLLAG